MPKDLYEVLGVARNASEQEIRNAHRHRAFERHPDRNPGDEAAAEDLREITLAFEILTDPERRERYDSTGDCTETEADNSHVQLTKKLSLTLTTVLAHLLQSGAEPKQCDVVGEMGKFIRKKLLMDSEAIGKGDAILKKLQALLGRFREKDERGLLEQSVRAQIAELQEQQKKIRADNVLDQEALDYLKECSFRKDEALIANWMGMKGVFIYWDKGTAT